MLYSTVLHHSRGAGGDVVGISWKAPTKLHPSPSLVVTCSHQVVVYKPAEEQRTHQWSFKPSAATVLSHPAVYIPVASRYVGVQQGSILVSWKETEQSVKRPLSTQANGAVQAVHTCPQLGDYFVTVLTSGGVSLFKGGLQCVAQISDTKDISKVVWSGVLGVTLVVVAKVGAKERLSTFALSLGSSSRPASPGAAFVTLISSHVLPKPPRPTDAGESIPADVLCEEASACSAAFLGGGGSWSRSGGVMAVAWWTPHGPAWTKIVIDASGIREEFVRSVVTRVTTGTALVALNGTEEATSPAALTNGKKSRLRKGKNLIPAKTVIVGESSSAGRSSSVPVLAAADGGRLLVHSGDACPRLSMWDATYGVLLENEGAPETTDSRADAAITKRVASMMVSGNGTHLALAVAGKVLVCPVPVREAGTLSSLLKRRRISSVTASSTSGLERMYPAVDLLRSASAAGLLDNTGAVEPERWDASVVSPFRDAEANMIRLLEDATRRKDSDLFQCVVQKYVQQHWEEAGGIGDDGEDWRRKRPRGGGDSILGVVTAAAVELCLANPNAALWGALAMLIKSGGVSARQHRGLVEGVIEYAPKLLEEVMIHVPDLPEADTVRILGHFLSQASILASSSRTSPGSISMEGSELKTSGGALAKRARSQSDGDANDVRSHLSENTSPGKNKKAAARRSVNDAASGHKKKTKKKKKYEEDTVQKQAPLDSEAGIVEKKKGINGTTDIVSLSNGYAGITVAQNADSCSGGKLSNRTVCGGESSVRVQTRVGTGVEQGMKNPAGEKTPGDAHSPWEAVALVERAVRVAVALPHNEAFLRTALAGRSHGEIIIVLKVLTRLLSEGERSKGAQAKLGGIADGGPIQVVQMDAVLGWASAVLDSHFTRLAIVGATDGNLVAALEALKKTARREAECCEMLSQVRSLVDEVARRHAAAEAEKARRHPERNPFSLRVLRF